ncbi:hypothetical protein QQF64_009023 [Cirrhinus molitorella]|uniref:Uncharacterized protein n=2 Tax=Cirrhinus molitorella TaxID=172907 RepID=A0ABR3MA86_9TELE|nr:hypothetical protein Q8A67_017980 [Cirrhinus molitorella]
MTTHTNDCDTTLVYQQRADLFGSITSAYNNSTIYQISNDKTRGFGNNMGFMYEVSSYIGVLAEEPQVAVHKYEAHEEQHKNGQTGEDGTHVSGCGGCRRAGYVSDSLVRAT